MILSCEGGGGHTAVAKALNNYLSDEFEIHIVSDFFYGLLQPQSLAAIGISGEAIYNYLLANKWYRAINWYYKAGIWFFNTLTHKTSINKIKKYLIQHKPDLVISVNPVTNNLVLQATQSLNIPFLLVPTDLDIQTFIAKIKSPTYLKFRLAIPFETPETSAATQKAEIRPSMVFTTGFVIRPSFFEPKNTTAIKKEFTVPENKPVILLLLGAVGVDKIVTFTQSLAHITSPAHLLICIGKNEALRPQIEAVHMPPHITNTIIGFTDKIADLMAITDLFITKSGSVSVNEAIYMNLPMILDATSPLLRWEAKNHRFIQEKEFGISLTEIEQLPAIVDSFLSSQHQLSGYSQRLKTFEKKHGGTEVKKLIKKMLAL